MFLKRRDFLKAVAVSVGALVVGCGSDDDTSNNVNPTCYTGLEDGSMFFPQSVASGDPSPSTVILWTRVEDGDGDISLQLQLALDEEFTQIFDLGDECGRVVTALAAFDNCVKIRLEDLDPGTTYYYRFVYEKDGTRYASRVGRTATAPAADADTAVKFAFASCQDINGKYYNPYKHMVTQDDIDFVVHLGDYVYETTGDPQFQETTPGRGLIFRNPEEAIVFNEGEDNQYYAAKSLGNYRDMYRTYRADPWLQRAHELFPFIAIWDDHEYSDDCYGATATYTDGREDETDVDRRKAANQAWYEYMPVDYLDAPDFEYDASANYPDDLRIYRDIRYGKNLHVVMTDLRTYRADHVIAEDMFPGTLLLNQTDLEAQEGSLPAWADPYVDIDTYDGGTYKTVLTDAAGAAGYDAADVAGNISVTFINGVVASVNENLPQDMQIPLIDPTGLEAGLTAISMGKTGATGQLGSRYFVVQDAFLAYARSQYAATSGASENTLGDAQEAWFLETVNNSDATWKVWGNEFTLTQRMIDLTSLGATLGDQFAKRFLLSAEDWDGLPNKRDELISALSDAGNVVAITGDIHAFFAGNPYVTGDTSKRIIEFVTGAISSSSMKRLLINTASSDPTLAAAGAAALAAGIEQFLQADTVPNPDMAYINSDHQGYATLTVDGEQMQATFYELAETNSVKDLSSSEVEEELQIQQFSINAGAADLFTVNDDGDTVRWDPTTGAWV